MKMMESIETGRITYSKFFWWRIVPVMSGSPGKLLKMPKCISTCMLRRMGQKQWLFLRRGGLANAPRPDLILLDLNLPKKDGREVLQEIKNSPALKSIPIVILTTSLSEEDILRSYLLHANCYITKPVNLDGFLKVVKSIDNFWLSIVTLPPPTPS